MVRISELMGGGFAASRAAVRAGATELVEAGGRGSGKSSYSSLELLLQLFKHPGCHAVVIRKVASSLRNSAYRQVQWSIAAMGAQRKFRCGVSPMEIEYLPTGQKILFFGMDDDGKLKSLKMPFGYVGLLWFEELDQFTAEEVRSVEQSVLRGGDFSLTLKTFNPPADPKHWANQYFLEPKKGKFTHKSTYLELPEEWLGRRFIEDAQHLKSTNPRVYDHEYLGIPIGNGSLVFPNLRLEKVDPGSFDRVRAGVDWGWWPDPWAFNRCALRAGRLYIIDEAQGFRLSNQVTAQMVRSRVAEGEPVVCDSAESKSVADYRAAGIRARAAQKGPGSVAYGIKWLQSLEAIVVDPERCPNTAREFGAYAYEDGALPDRENHHIDAVRYACQGFWRNGPF